MIFLQSFRLLSCCNTRFIGLSIHDNTRKARGTLEKVGIKVNFWPPAQFLQIIFMIQDEETVQDKCDRTLRRSDPVNKMQPKRTAAGGNSDEIGHVSQKTCQDEPYYRYFLLLMPPAEGELVSTKNKLGRASGAGSGRKRGKRGGRRQESAKEEGRMKPKNVGSSKQESSKAEETWQR